MKQLPKPVRSQDEDLELRGRILRALGVFDEREPDPSAEQRFDKGQPRDPGGEGGGQWIKGLAGAAKAAGKLINKAADAADGKDGDKGNGKSKLGGPLTDAEIEQRGTMVGQVINEARKTLATEHTHTTEGGAWTPERDLLHREIAHDLYNKGAGTGFAGGARHGEVPKNREAVIAGGLGGAGKTTVLTKHAGIDPNNYLVLNPDDVKEELARRNLIPEVPGHPELSPMERAALVHEESSRITSLMADKAYREGRNVMWDITMSSESSVASRVQAMRAAGYDSIKGVFVDIPVEVSVDRAMGRYRRGVADHFSGKGYGGRFVPPSIIRAQRTKSGATVNRQVFDKSRKQFTDWSIYDNSVTGEAPKLVADKPKPPDLSVVAQGLTWAGTAPEPPGKYKEWPQAPGKVGT